MAALVQAVEFLMVAVVLLKFGNVEGWSVYEIGYMYGVIMLSKAIYRMFASDVHWLEKYLISGDLDQLLVRPVPVLLALMSQNFSVLAGEVLQGGTILSISMHALMAAGQLSWWSVPVTMAVVASGAVILFAIGLATATVGFWVTRVQELQVLTEDAARNAAQYPLSLYPNWLRTLLLSAIPVGFVNYVPALSLLRHQFGAWVIGGTAASAGLFLWLALQFWRFGLTRYQSTGS
jgi:ABC-2 type transport system permease protein